LTRFSTTIAFTGGTPTVSLAEPARAADGDARRADDVKDDAVHGDAGDQQGDASRGLRERGNEEKHDRLLSGISG
jgi:hypothetical protein